LHLVMQKTDMVYCLNRHLCCQGKPEDINKHPEYLALLDNSLEFKNGSEIAFYSHHHDHIHKI
jgi:zinc transport system ATP-binding protein